MATLGAFDSHVLESRSSLDLLDGSGDGLHMEDLPERSRDLSVEGAPASTIKRLVGESKDVDCIMTMSDCDPGSRTVSKISPRKAVERKVGARRGVGTRRRASASNNNNNNNNNSEVKEEGEEEPQIQWLVRQTCSSFHST
jgi:hypothetical protein